MALSKIRNDSLADTAVHGRRNILINGAMQINQRGDQTGITSAGTYGVDRWKNFGGGFGTISLTQESDAPAGFAYSNRVKFTTARSTTAASDHSVIGTTLEGQNLQHFEKGTSNAKKMTVSFYAKASQSTTIQLELYDADNTRHAGKEFAITTSWAKYSYTFEGDTTGTFDADANLSLYVFFWLGASTNYTSGTNPDGSWLSGDDTRRVHSDVGTTFMDTLNAEFNYTGVQLEVGDKATPFEHRSYGEELALCQRYYHVGKAYEALESDELSGTVHFPTTMRAAPTTSSTVDETNGGFTNLTGLDTSIHHIGWWISNSAANKYAKITITCDSEL